jgi:N-acetyl-anhydromuramyl-L-alanine amidase AmpD
MSNGSFTDSQRVEVRKLIQHLMAVFKIPKQNVLRHRDIAPKRKTDIADTFWNNAYKTWADYQNSLTPKEQ